MKKVSKILCFLVSMTLVFSFVLAGCGDVKKTESTTETGAVSENTAEKSAASNSPDISEKAELSMYLLGTPAKEYDLALTELNKKMEKDINATLKVNWIGWGDFSTKYPLILASGEPIDLIFTATWAFYKQQAQKGAFMELEDLLPRYAPISYKEEPKDAFAQAKVNGKIYCLPMNYDEYGSWGYIVRGDLMKKYNITEIKSLDDMGKYLDAVKKNENRLTPISFSSSKDDSFESPFLRSQKWFEPGTMDYTTGPLVYNIEDATGKVFNRFEKPEMMEFFKKMYDWAQKGYWSKSVLSNKVAAKDAFKNGQSAACATNLIDFNNSIYMPIKAQHQDWEPMYFEAANWIYINEYIANAMAIPVSAKNPERALMLLEKLRTDEEYFDLTTYGVKDKHFEFTPDGKQIKSLDGDKFGPDSSCPWGWRVGKFYKDPVGSYPKLDEIRNTYKTMNVKIPLQSFSLNTDAIKAELSNLSNVMQQYEFPLKVGLVDPEKYVPILNQKLKEAGLEKVQTEVQKQIDEYLKTAK